MNEQTNKKLYPDQTAKPTYFAQIRHVTVEGWLTYGAPDGLIIRVVVSNGQGMPVEREDQMDPYLSSGEARQQAKRMWQAVCMKVVASV